MERRPGQPPALPKMDAPTPSGSDISDARSGAAHEALKSVQGTKKEMSADVRKARQATDLAPKEAYKSEKRVGENERIAELIKQINETPTEAPAAAQPHLVEKTSLTDANAWDDVEQKVDALVKDRDKVSIFAKAKGFFKKLFTRKDKWADRTADMASMSDAAVKSEVDAQAAAELQAANDAGEAFQVAQEKKAAQGQGLADYTVGNVAKGLQKGFDAARQVGATTVKEAKPGKWERLASKEGDLDIMLAEGAAIQKAAKADKKSKAYTDKLEAKAGRGAGMVESVTDQAAGALQSGLETIRHTGATTVNADKQPRGNNAKVERAMADMAGMDQDDVVVENLENQMNETLAANAKGQAYADKLETKAQRGPGMVESVVGDAAEALQSGMDTITDFVYQGRNTKIGALAGGEEARTQLSQMMRSVPAREYKALLTGVEGMGGFEGKAAKDRIGDIVKNLPEDQMFTLMQGLSPDSTIRELARSIAESRDTE